MIKQGRVVKKLPGYTNGINGNRHPEHGDESEEDDEDSEGDEERESDDESEDEREDLVTVNRMALSLDGQWLATSDTAYRTHVFNLDSVQASINHFYLTC